MAWNEDKTWALVVVGLFTCIAFGIKSCSEFNNRIESNKREVQAECLKHNTAAECRKLFVTTSEHHL